MRYTLLLLLLLSVSMQAQDKIITHHDEVINGFVVEISETSVFYSTDSVNENLKRIAKEDILMILKADGTVINMSETTPATPVAEVAEQPDRFPIVDLSQYHGYLLQKGNCVYIPTDSKLDYERAGQEEFKRLMEERGYWQVVDKLEQAHFVAIFVTSLVGWDSSILYFRTREEYAKSKSVIIDLRRLYYTTVNSDIIVQRHAYANGESKEGNIEAANYIMQLAEVDMKWLNKILKGWITCRDQKPWTLP